MKKFDKILNEELDQMPVSSEIRGKLDLVLELQHELEDAKNRVSELKMEMAKAVEEYNFELGVALRKKLPKVSVNFANGKCSTKYKSTNLCCAPDLENGLWSFEPNRHGRQFSRKNAHTLRLSNKLDPLVDAMVSYLSDKYRSL